MSHRIPRTAEAQRRERFYFIAVLGLALLAAFLTVHGIYGAHGHLALRAERREYNTLRQQIRQIRRQNERLEKQVAALKSDPHAIERQAREQLHLARPGELVFTLPDSHRAKP